MPHHRRRSRVCRFLAAAAGVSVGALALAGASTQLYPRPLGLAAGSWSPQLGQDRLFAPPPELLLGPPPQLLVPPPPQMLLTPPPEFLLPPLPEPTYRRHKPKHSFPRRLLPVRDQSAPQQEDDAVLLPDREVLILAAESASAKPTCVFQDGSTSPARALGRLPGPGRHAYLCPLPDSAQSRQPLQAPMLVSSSSASAAAPAPTADLPARAMLNWNNSLVFDSAVLHGGDVILFAKGPNHRQGIIRTATANVQCIYRRGADGTEASLPAITSAQQVIRCPPPPIPLSSGNIDLHVTVALNGDDPIPSIATYNPQQTGLSLTPEKNLICACTMVRNVAKFLPEWVLYHSAVGVDQFFLYDNGSEDGLAEQVDRLKAAGINISTVAWPWTKTQEAGLSHCAALHQASCQWMAFIDVDEFIFNPNWQTLEKPSKSLLEAVVLSADPHVGQIYLRCFDFGPSGQKTHPLEGVCQGYTCRVDKVLRHKSMVRLDTVEDSLANHVHHFTLKSGFHHAWNMVARVNHYKYQAWPEFKSKFKRRVSAFVADWSDPVNLQSNDRAPGLGVDPVEPAGWAESFCEVTDRIMQEVSTRWFGIGFRGHGSETEFNSDGNIALSPSLP